jgi:hypothetical protein
MMPKATLAVVPPPLCRTHVYRWKDGWEWASSTPGLCRPQSPTGVWARAFKMATNLVPRIRETSLSPVCLPQYSTEFPKDFPIQIPRPRRPLAQSLFSSCFLTWALWSLFNSSCLTCCFVAFSNFLLLLSVFFSYKNQEKKKDWEK